MRFFPRHGIAWVASIGLVATQIVACGSVLDSLPGGGGSSGGDSTSLGPAPTSGVLSGVATDAFLRNATVNIYAWNGAKGELLGSGVTDDRGRYALQLQVRSQSVLLEVSGGVYTEEVTLRDVSLVSGQVLYAVQNYTSGQSLTTSVTYYTTLATGLAENLVQLGMRPPDAVEEANARVARIIGVDTRGVIPADILNPDGFSLPELRYGFATAALSSLTERASILNDTEPHAVFTSVKFIQAAYDDVRADGVLNGSGVNGEVVFGKIRLNPEIYRHELALHILRIANNKRANRTGRGPMEMFDLARRLNESTDPIFGGDPIIPIDNDKPNVSSLFASEFPNLPNDAVVFGGLNIGAMVISFPGAATAQLLLDDQVIGTAADPENPSVPLETFNPPIADGQHTLKFRVTDISGAVAESAPLDVNVSNQQTAIENVSIAGQFVGKETMVTADIVDPARPQKIEYSVKLQGANSFLPLATIFADSGAAMLQAAAVVDPRQLPSPDGDAAFKVEITNSVGFIFAKEVPFVIDRTPPTSSNFQITPVAGSGSVVSSGSTTVVRGSVDVSAQVDDSFGIASARIAISGTEIPSIVANQGISSITTARNFDTSRVPDGVNVVSVFASDRAGNQIASTAGFEFEVDNTGPVINLTGLRFAGNRCRLMGNASDQRLESVVFVSPGNERFPLTVSATGDFEVNLGNSGIAQVEAMDRLGNRSTRRFRVDNSELDRISLICEISEDGRRLFRIT